MKAKSIKGKSTVEIKSALEQSMADGFKPTLAVIFLSIKQDKETLQKLMKNNGIDIFGVTSSGEFIDGNMEEESTVILLLDMDRSYYKIGFRNVGTGNTREKALEIGRLGLETFKHPAYIVCGSGVNSDGEMIIRGIEDVSGEEVTIVGGMAGDDFNMLCSYVFTSEEVSDNGIVCIIVDEDKIGLHSLAICGWQPVGTVKTITKSNGCWVYTIDNQPALDIIVKYMGLSSINRENRTDVIVQIGSNFPMEVQTEDGGWVMRTAMLGNWNDNSFMCAGNVPEGSKIRFTLPADFEVIDKVIDCCKEVKRTQLPEIDALILFDCKARHIALGPVAGQEIEGLRQVWKAPMAGYFAYGEFGRAPGKRQ
jgi:hypothetical protein